MLMSRRQVDHLGGKCSRMPKQLKFQTAGEFNDLRSLRNPDGTWMRIHFRETNGEFRAALGAIGDAIFERSEVLGVQGILRA